MSPAVHAFAEVIEDVSGGNPKLPQSAFAAAGSIPVIDQGQRHIAGYTDDESLKCRVELPVIVFGDHTRTLKYVDFPFVMGADGVKVLRVRDGWDAKYVFHYLRWRDLPSAGYSRHYKFLRELWVPKPADSEQRRIAAVLDKADALRVKRQQALDRLDALQQSIFLDMFGDPGTNPRQLQTRSLGGWVGEDAPITYGILKPGQDVPKGVPYVRVVDIRDGQVMPGGVRRTLPDIDAAYSRSRLRTGDLVISIRGHVGRLGVVPVELDGANITQDSARIRLHGCRRDYVAGALSTPALRRWMARRT